MKRHKTDSIALFSDTKGRFYFKELRTSPTLFCIILS